MTYFKNDPRTLTLANGTALTTANNAAPDAFTVTSGGAGGTIIHRTSGGNLAGRHTEFVGAAVTARMDWAFASARYAVWAAVDLGNSAPGSDQVILTLNTTTGPRIAQLATGELRVFDNGGSVYTTPAPVTGRVAIYFGAEIGTGTADGEVHLAVYTGANVDTAASAAYTFDSAVRNTGTSNFPHMRIGKNTTAGTATYRVEYVHWFDSQYTATGLGPLNSNVAPTANAGADQTVEPWALVTIGGTDTDTDGTIASVAWTQTSGPATPLSSTSVASPTFTAPGTVAGTSLTYQKTATDNAGAASSDQVTITVLPASERLMVGGTWVAARIRLV